MITLQQLLARARRAATVSAVAAFALVQGMAPLLHAHVAPSAADSQIGIHLPVAVLHKDHGHETASLSVGVVLEESSAITVPPEHRRNEATVGDPPLAAAASAIPFSAPAGGTSPVESGRVVAAGGLHLRPPAQAPPASV